MSDFINTIDALGDDVVVDSIIDRSITEFKDDNLTTVGAYAFYGCAALETVDLPNVRDLSTDSFNGCSSLKEFVGEKLVYGPYVGDRAFFNCTSLEKIELPNLAGSLIQYSIFGGCTALTKVDFPLVTKLSGGHMFRGCTALRALILRNTAVCHLGATTLLQGTPIESGTGYIYVPRALIEDYKVATNWSTFAAQFRTLEDYTVDGTTTGELDESKI